MRREGGNRWANRSSEVSWAYTSFRHQGMARIETPTILLPRLIVGRKTPFMVPVALATKISGKVRVALTYKYHILTIICDWSHNA